MNYEIYKCCIVPFIGDKTRQILIQKEMWLIGYKRLIFNPSYHKLILDIYIHLGSPCYKYCVCKLFHRYLIKNPVQLKLNDFEYV